MAKGSRGGQGYSKYKNKNPSQAYLKEIYDSTPRWDIRTIQDEITLAKIFTKEKATKDNFFENSIGEWDKKSSPPRREADYVSINRRTGKISSQYWYTDEGVYRKSNHWGSDVASCSWYIKGRKYGDQGVVVGNTETAFIKWSNLYAKGTIGKAGKPNALSKLKEGTYFIKDFKFKK